MYAEPAPAGSKAPFALFHTPGMESLVTVGTGPIIGSIEMGGLLYVVSGNTLYSVDTSWTATEIGDVSSVARVGMAHNGTQILIACGVEGYIYSVAGGLVQITDADYPGGDQVDFIDGFFIVSQDGEGTFWKSAAYDGTDWTATDFATAEGSPDNIVGQIVDHREVWLFGTKTTEIWFNEGVNAFPFARLQNAFIEVGCAARWSVAKTANTVFWLGNDRVVYQAAGYQEVPISTYALGQEIEGYSTINDAIAYTYTDKNHKFYVLTFPSESKTWVYDITTQLWHEREHYAYNVNTGDFGIRHRSNTYTYFNSSHVIGDYKNGNLYRFKRDVYTDGSGAGGTTEKITNGSFATSSDWILTGSAAIGLNAAGIIAGFSANYLTFGVAAGTAKQDSVFTAGNTYTVTLKGSNFNVPTVEIYNGSGEDQLIGAITGITTIDYSWEFTATSSDGAFYVKSSEGGDGSAAAIDDISVLETSASSTAIQRIFHSGVVQNMEKLSTMGMLQVVFEQGTGLITGQGSDPQVMLQFSDDGGKTWSHEKWRSIGKIGRYKHRSIWRRLGSFRSRIFRWVISDSVAVVVLSAYGE